MTELRKKRLLLYAQCARNHKRWYGQYCELQRQGLTSWQFGYASLTHKGKIELNKLLTQ